MEFESVLGITLNSKCNYVATFATEFIWNRKWDIVSKSFASGLCLSEQSEYFH